MRDSGELRTVAARRMSQRRLVKAFQRADAPDGVVVELEEGESDELHILGDGQDFCRSDKSVKGEPRDGRARTYGAREAVRGTRF